MTRIFLTSFLLGLIILLAGCAGSRHAAEQHPLEGDWSYRVNSDEEIYEGVLEFTATEDVLTGAIEGEGTAGSTPLSNVAFEAPRLSFEFTSPQYGLLKVSVDVEDDSFAGWMEVPAYATSVSIQGARLVAP